MFCHCFEIKTSYYCHYNVTNKRQSNYGLIFIIDKQKIYLWNKMLTSCTTYMI
ncbi:hypothetical protein HMPREF0880_02366 [Yokenella regensburgei ATCC 43003]|nr:hypothetical protein HMPREF0880_02366 [Yokenella regensburgei ATCC 43003]